MCDNTGLYSKNKTVKVYKTLALFELLTISVIFTLDKQKEIDTFLTL